MFFFFLPLPKDEPCGPERKDQRDRDAAADVQVVQRNVVEIAKETVLEQFPHRQYDRDDGDAGERQRHPEPIALPGRRAHRIHFQRHEGRVSHGTANMSHGSVITVTA